MNTPSNAAMTAVEELQQMEDAINQGEIDSVLKGKSDGNRSGNGNGSGSNGPNGTPDDPKGAEKLPGRDDLLAFLEQNADSLPNGAAGLKEMQRTIAAQGNAKRELEERLAKLEEAKKEPEGPTPEEQRRKAILARLPRAQREAMEAMIEEMGLVSRDEIEEEKAVEESTKLTAQSIAEGIEAWGEEFGHMEDDKFIWNPEIFEGVRGLYRDLKSPDKGITPNQLFILHNFDKLIEKAKSEAQGGVGKVDRINRLQRANGMNRNSTSMAPSGPPIREEGDNLEDVTAKAVRNAWRKLVG